MYKLKKVLPDTDKVTIVPFGDVHFGSPACDWGAFTSMLKWAAGEKNLYLLGMGDFFDGILVDDKRFDASQGICPSFLRYYEQMKKALAPCKDKIIGLHSGNHELTLSKKGYGDPIEQIADALRIPFLGYSAFTQLTVRRKYKHERATSNNIIIYSHHGWFSGRKMGSKANNLTDLAAYWDADVYCVAHSHDLFGVRKVKVDFNGARKLIFCQTGTFMKTSEWNTTTYSERAGYPPTKIGISRIEWYPWKRKRVPTGIERGDLHIIE